MILCVNLNAAIDKTIVVNSFQLGEIHRPEAVKALAGGKGCNVARALQTLGESPVVTGWVGGTAGQFIKNGLQAEGIATDFVYTDFESRTCTSILDSSNQAMTEIYENGDPVPSEKVNELLDHFKAIVGNYKAVTLSGSIPPGVPQDIYAQLIEIARGAEVPTFLDSSKEPLLKGVAAKPWFVKPNEDEVAILVGQKPQSHAEFSHAAKKIADLYDTTVVVSLGKSGAITARGNEIVHVQPPLVEAKSAVGSGDCLVAGLVKGFLEESYLTHIVKNGIAAGTANTLVVGAGQFNIEDFDAIIQQVYATS